MLIGQHIAEMIPDGATLQMGIGSIPDAVLQNLHSHWDLGIQHRTVFRWCGFTLRGGHHQLQSEDFSSGENGGRFLFVRPSLSLCRQQPYRRLHPTEYVCRSVQHCPCNNDMVAINAALQVDLNGQVRRLDGSCSIAALAGNLTLSGGGALQRWPADHCPPIDRQERYDQPNFPALDGRLRRDDHAQRRSLYCDGSMASPRSTARLSAGAHAN